MMLNCSSFRGGLKAKSRVEEEVKEGLEVNMDKEEEEEEKKEECRFNS